MAIDGNPFPDPWFCSFAQSQPSRPLFSPTNSFWRVLLYLPSNETKITSLFSQAGVYPVFVVYHQQLWRYNIWHLAQFFVGEGVGVRGRVSLWVSSKGESNPPPQIMDPLEVSDFGGQIKNPPF